MFVMHPDIVHALVKDRRYNSVIYNAGAALFSALSFVQKSIIFLTPEFLTPEFYADFNAGS